MEIFDFDAAQWESALDIYAAIYEAVAAPPGYSRNINGLLEAMIWDQSGDPDYPPYAVRIRNVQAAPQEVQSEIRLIGGIILEALDEFQQINGRRFPLSFEVS